MLTDSQVQQFNRNGFINAGQVLDDAQVQELYDDLMRIIDKGPDGFADGETRPVLFRDMTQPQGDTAGSTAVVGATPVWQIVNIWEASPVFKKLMFHPFIVKAIYQLTGFGDLQVWHDQVQYKPANVGGATTWHQDAPLWPSIEPQTPVSAWIPFADATEENGCMWMVPGSHRWGDQQAFLDTQNHLRMLDEFSDIKGYTPPADAQINQIQCKPCPVKRGEVHFHHSLTWHGSPENKSPNARPGLAIHYMTSASHFTGSDHPMKQFIGVDVGGSMLEAGPHFPVVSRGGEPVVL